MPVLHVMPDGFPAAQLKFDYHLRLTPVISPPQSWLSPPPLGNLATQPL
jgi:hypothetical protein